MKLIDLLVVSGFTNTSEGMYELDLLDGTSIVLQENKPDRIILMPGGMEYYYPNFTEVISRMLTSAYKAGRNDKELNS